MTKRPIEYQRRRLVMDVLDLQISLQDEWHRFLYFDRERDLSPGQRLALETTTGLPEGSLRRLRYTDGFDGLTPQQALAALLGKPESTASSTPSNWKDLLHETFDYAQMRPSEALAFGGSTEVRAALKRAGVKIIDLSGRPQPGMLEHYLVTINCHGQVKHKQTQAWENEIHRLKQRGVIYPVKTSSSNISGIATYLYDHRVPIRDQVLRSRAA